MGKIQAEREAGGRERGGGRGVKFHLKKSTPRQIHPRYLKLLQSEYDTVFLLKRFFNGFFLFQRRLSYLLLIPLLAGDPLNARGQQSLRHVPFLQDNLRWGRNDTKIEGSILVFATILSILIEKCFYCCYFIFSIFCRDGVKASSTY